MEARFHNGHVAFHELNGRIIVDLQFGDLAPMSTHGLHIHEHAVPPGCDTGDCCSDAGGHFTLDRNREHGAFPDPCHEGDLINNITTNQEGAVNMTFYADSLGRVPLADLEGKSVVLHAGEDDCGRRGRNGVRYSAMDLATLALYGRDAAALEAKSLKDGNAGARIGCATIRRE